MKRLGFRQATLDRVRIWLVSHPGKKLIFPLGLTLIVAGLMMLALLPVTTPVTKEVAACNRITVLVVFGFLFMVCGISE